MRRGAPLELIRTNKEGHVGKGKIKVSPGCSDQEMVAFKILRATGRVHCMFTTLNFRRTDFGLFKDLLRRALWDMALERSGPQESWLVFKDHLLQAQEQPIPSWKLEAVSLTLILGKVLEPLILGPFLGTRRARTSSGAVSMDSPRETHA